MPRKSSTDLVPKAKKEIVVSHSKPSFLSNIKDGLAYGIGNAIAHRMVGSALNGGGSSGSSSAGDRSTRAVKGGGAGISEAQGALAAVAQPVHGPGCPVR